MHARGTSVGRAHRAALKFVPQAGHSRDVKAVSTLFSPENPADQQAQAGEKLYSVE